MTAPAAAEVQHRVVSDVAGRQRAGLGLTSTATTLAVGKLLGGMAAAGTLPLLGSLALSLTAGIAVRTWLLHRMKSADTDRTPSAAALPEEPARIWQRRIEFQALQVRDHLDEAALAVLRQAFRPVGT